MHLCLHYLMLICPSKLWFGCGAVVLQNQRLVAFHSYKFNFADRSYGGGEQLQQVLAVITALRQWRCHLEAAKEVVVLTDHESNTYLVVSPLCSSAGCKCIGRSFCFAFTSSGSITRALPM